MKEERKGVNYFEKIFIFILSLVLVISFSIIPFFQQAHAASEGVHKPKSNVSTKTKKK